MEMLEGWQLATMVEHLMNLFIKGALSLASSILLLRIFVEVFKSYFSYKFKFTLPQFVPILMVLIGLLTYAEIMPMIGDAFYSIGEQLRGQAELSFKLTNIWTALQQKLGMAEEEQSMWELAKKWAGHLADQANPFDWLQNWWALSTSLTWQAIGILFRYGMVFFKNIVYCYMLMCGPIPLVLSLIPGFGGFAAHWFKNFIVVCYWNITIAVLDAILKALNVQLIADIALGGDEEMTIGLLTMLSAIMYLFVPYLTSLAIGQTVVAMAGSKMVMTPLATAAGVLRMAAGGGAGGSPAKSSASSGSATAATDASSGSEQRNQAGLLTMGSQPQQGVRTSYAAYPMSSRSQGNLSGRSVYQKSIGHSGNRKRVIIPQANQQYENSPVIYASEGRIPAERRLPAAQTNALPDNEHKPKYSLGPKKE